MKIIQILGPSYSGSTAIGYALNTVDGYFFGSEVRKIFPQFRQEGKGLPRCDHCGAECRYWTDSLVSRIIRNAKGLEDLYDMFAEEHPEVACFVDGSKTISSGRSVRNSFRLLTAKHPVRLLASHLYNSGSFGLKDVAFDRARSLIDEDPVTYLEFSDQVLAKLLRAYEIFFRRFQDDLILFRSDLSHLDGFAQFRRLEEHLDLPPHGIKPERFTEFPCHSVGGNRAPVWASREARGHAPVKAPRATYYREKAGSYGDWRLDDKYDLLFPAPFVDRVRHLVTYRDLCDRLKYDPDSLHAYPSPRA